MKVGENYSQDGHLSESLTERVLIEKFEIEKISNFIFFLKDFSGKRDNMGGWKLVEIIAKMDIYHNQ